MGAKTCLLCGNCYEHSQINGVRKRESHDAE